nr:hypothetical protein [Tanacetum cinerariifolium]
MVNLSEDIQCAGFDTRSPMFDMADFASWQQRIRLYCRGKDNGVNILKSIDEEPFQMRTFKETFAEGDEGLSPTDNLIENLTNTLALLTRSYKTYLPQTNNQLKTSSNIRNQATIQNDRVVVQNVQGRQNRGQRNNARGAVDNIFQVDQCDAFDFDVDEAPTAQTMFMADLSSADPVYDEAGPLYDSDILSESKVVNASLTAELARYNEQVELYERRAKFELTEREQKIDEQLRIVITDRNIKEENLKKKLHSVKMQLNSTITHNKSMVKERKVAIGYKNPLYLTHAKQVQPDLCNGHEIVKTNHVPAIVHDSKDTLEIGETTGKKMKDPMYVKKKVKIIPLEYLNESYLATFTP